MTTHVARHTFATFALANGVSIESVAKMLGHTNVQMTRHYARVLDRTVIREMSQIKMDFHFPCKERVFGMSKGRHEVRMPALSGMAGDCFRPFLFHSGVFCLFWRLLNG